MEQDKGLSAPHSAAPKVASEAVGAIALALLAYVIFGVIVPASIAKDVSATEFVILELELLLPLVGYVALCEALRRRALALRGQTAAHISLAIVVLLLALSIVSTLHLLYVRHEAVSSGLGALAAGGFPSSAKIVLYNLVWAMMAAGWGMAAFVVGRTEPITAELRPRMRAIAIAALAPALLAFLYACLSLVDDEPLALGLLGAFAPREFAQRASEFVVSIRLLIVTGSCTWMLTACSGLAALGLGRDPLVAPRAERLRQALTWLLGAIVSIVAIVSLLVMMAALDATHGHDPPQMIVIAVGVIVFDALVLGLAALVAAPPRLMLSLAAAERQATEQQVIAVPADAPPLPASFELAAQPSVVPTPSGLTFTPPTNTAPPAGAWTSGGAPAAPAPDGLSAPASRTGRYKFTAGGFDAWGVMLVNGLLVVITCGIALILGVPASRMQYWAITNTARDGQRFRYEVGTGEAIGAAVMRALLLLVTCGFALPWTSAMSQRFRVEHTSTAEGHRMRFTGSGGDVLGFWLLAMVALPLSLGLAWPWLAVLRERWVASSTVVLDPSAPGGEYRLRFDAGPLSYFVQGVLSLLLSIVTLGLYSPFAIASYHAFVWSSMSDTLSPPISVPSGPRTAGQWAVVVAAGMSVTLLVGACLFLAVLPKVFGRGGSGTLAGGSHEGWSTAGQDDSDEGGWAEDDEPGSDERSRRAALAAQPCSLPCAAGSQCRGGSCVTLRLAAEDAAYTDRADGRGWGDRCIGHMRAGALDDAEAACAQGLGMATTSAVRGALLYNLGLISERRGARDAARGYYRHSLEVRPGNAAVERALAVLGVSAAEPSVSGNAMAVVDGDLNASALAWWRRGDAAARDRLAADGVSPTLVRATASLNVRAGPGANERFVRTLPEGTIVVALRGTVGGIPSLAGRGNWSRVVASETLSGWVASGVTSDYRGCTPEPDALLAQVAGNRAVVVRRDMLFSRIENANGNPMFLLTARDPEANASYVGLFASDRRCQLEQRRVVRVEGELEDALVTWTAQQGGEPLLGAGVRAFGAAGAPTTWRVWSIDVSEPVWQETVPTAMDIPDSQRGSIAAPFVSRRGATQGWWPVRVRRPGQEPEYYEWTGSTLEIPLPGEDDD